MRTLKLTLAYDGSGYAGWQRQENALAIQQVVEEAFAHFTGGKAPTISGAGRTDAGVHALGQVASVNVEFDHSASAVMRALNVRLPDAIRAVGAVDAPTGFHARFNATGKSYRYRIQRTPVMSPFERLYGWHVPWSLDLDAMRAAAAALVGRHDFASFQASGTKITETTRTLERLEIQESGSELLIHAEGDGFLRQMVRIIAGTLVDVGSGQRDAASMPGVLAARNREAAGKTAPAHGLTLVAVRY
ncbi:MAG: tRNA pseudouridine(38-40) synthase TruA [Acidobacteria bacterium]|nr:MAG: tRNA pseudouridine(38-40) synthase TruA [Acidobacteriota bacterium]